MPRQYTKVEALSEEVILLKSAGKTNREIGRPANAGGLALHSDLGSQYTSQAYFDLSQEYHLQPSMSSPGCPYDNAAMENFFGALKTECLYRMKLSCRTEVEQAVQSMLRLIITSASIKKTASLRLRFGARPLNFPQFYDRVLFYLSVIRGAVQDGMGNPLGLIGGLA